MFFFPSFPSRSSALDQSLFVQWPRATLARSGRSTIYIGAPPGGRSLGSAVGLGASEDSTGPARAATDATTSSSRSRSAGVGRRRRRTRRGGRRCGILRRPHVLHASYATGKKWRPGTGRCGAEASTQVMRTTMPRRTPACVVADSDNNAP